MRFPATFELAIAAMLFAILIGVPLGFIAAKRYQGVLDTSSLVISLIGISFPVFFLALLLKYIFSIKLGLLPTIGRLDITRSLEHPTNFYVLDSIIAGDMAGVRGHAEAPGPPRNRFGHHSTGHNRPHNPCRGARCNQRGLRAHGPS